jgi:hypothetical protein
VKETVEEEEEDEFMEESEEEEPEYEGIGRENLGLDEEEYEEEERLTTLEDLRSGINELIQGTQTPDVNI